MHLKPGRPMKLGPFVTIIVLFLSLPISETNPQTSKDSMADKFLLASILGRENRLTYEQYQVDYNKQHPSPFDQISLQQVYDKFAATGRFYCGLDESGMDLMSTANIVLDKDLLVLAGHAFYKGATCRPQAADFSTCSFYVNASPGKYVEHKIIPSTISTGGACEGGRPFAPVGSPLDYATVRLERPAPVKPYQVGNRCRLELMGQSTNVQAASRDFNYRGDSLNAPPSVQVCTNMQRDGETMKTTCSASFWASGSAVGCDAPDGFLFSGIVVSTTLDDKYNGKEFDDEFNFTRVIPLKGKFYDHVMDAQRRRR
jgi:hypothetical protein